MTNNLVVSYHFLQCRWIIMPLKFSTKCVAVKAQGHRKMMCIISVFKRIYEQSSHNDSHFYPSPSKGIYPTRNNETWSRPCNLMLRLFFLNTISINPTYGISAALCISVLCLSTLCFVLPHCLLPVNLSAIRCCIIDAWLLLRSFFLQHRFISLNKMRCRISTT
jgi:hypothetical protein